MRGGIETASIEELSRMCLAGEVAVREEERDWPDAGTSLRGGSGSRRSVTGTEVRLRLEADVVSFFGGTGEAGQHRMSRALLAHVDAKTRSAGDH